MSERRTSIMHVATTLGLGGSETILLQCLRHLDRSRYDQTICVLNHRTDAFGTQHLSEEARSLAPIDPIAMGERISLGDSARFHRLVAAMRRRRPDIVQTYLFRP